MVCFLVYLRVIRHVDLKIVIKRNFKNYCIILAAFSYSPFGISNFHYFQCCDDVFTELQLARF